MSKYRVIAKGDLEKKPHTWQKGLDYEVSEGRGYILLASDQGQIILKPEEKTKLAEMFDGFQIIGTTQSPNEVEAD